MKEKLQQLLKENPNWSDFGKKLRYTYSKLTIDNIEYTLNIDFPNDRGLGKFIQAYCIRD